MSVTRDLPLAPSPYLPLCSTLTRPSPISFLALPPTPLENTSQKSAGWNYPPEAPPRLSARREGGGAPSRPRGRTPMLPSPPARCDSARNPASFARLNLERAALTTRISGVGAAARSTHHTPASRRAYALLGASYRGAVDRAGQHPHPSHPPQHGTRTRSRRGEETALRHRPFARLAGSIHAARGLVSISIPII